MDMTDKFFKSIEMGEQVSLRKHIRTIEGMAIFLALEKCNRDKAAAARLLGMKRTTLVMKIQRFKEKAEHSKV